MARDLMGQTFGRLTVIQELPAERGKGKMWLCQCTCGNKKALPTSRLTSGHTRSCGCLLREHTADIHLTDITGQQFGRLVALRPTDQRDISGSIIWECRCDCGETALAPVNALRSGRVQSCGCLYRESRKEIAARRRDKMQNTLVSALVRSKQSRSDSQSGCTGVSLNKQTGKWLAYINFQKKRYFLGSFTQKEQAVHARKEAEKKLHDPFIADALAQLPPSAQQKFQQYLGTQDPP